MVETTRTPQRGDLVAGKYSIEERLGHGGMGAVYSARHTGTGRRFAIKLLNPQLAGDAEAEARFLREATLASAINHPAIVEVYDVGRHGSSPYMVMKLLEGESLGERLKRGPIAPEEAIAILLPVLDGVSAAHERGIVHRDLKPDNIMLQREGDSARPRVLDFGISKLLGADARTRLTKTGIMLGTPLYMSPEQVRGDRDIDARADVYALGVILYQMLTGALPFEGNNYPDLVLKIVEGGARSMRSLNPALPRRLEQAVGRAMAVAPEDRYVSAALFAADLRGLRSGVPPRLEARVSRSRAPTASTPFTAEAPSHPRTARLRPTVLWWIGAFAAIALGCGLLWLLRAAPQRQAGARRPLPPPTATVEAKSRASRAATSPAAPAPAGRAPGAPAAPSEPGREAGSIERAAAGNATAAGTKGSEEPSAAQAPRATVEPVAGRPDGSGPRGQHWPPSRPRSEGADAQAKSRKHSEPRNEPKPAPATRQSHSLPSEIIDPFEQ